MVANLGDIINPKHEEEKTRKIGDEKDEKSEESGAELRMKLLLKQALREFK